MKIKLLISLILFSLTSYSAVEKKVETVSYDKLRFKDNKAYRYGEDSFFTGKAKFGTDSITEIIYKNGDILNFKNIEDNQVLQNISFDENGELDGYFHFKDNNRILDGNIKNYLFSGTINVENEKYKGYVSVKNGILQGKMLINDDEYFYSQGILVKDSSEVEKARDIIISKNSISADLVEFNERNVKVKDITNFTGYILDEEDDLLACYRVIDNIIVEANEFYMFFYEVECGINFIMYSPKTLTNFEDDGSYFLATYDSSGKVEKYYEDDGKGKVSITKFDSINNFKIKFEVQNSTLVNKYVYLPDGSAIFYSYIDGGCEVICYDDIRKNKVGVKGQYKKNGNDYYESGTWKLYGENGEMEIYYEEKNMIIKEFYKDGSLKSEEKKERKFDNTDILRSFI